MSYLRFETVSSTKLSIVRNGNVVGAIIKENGTTAFLTRNLQEFSAEDLSSIRLRMTSDIGLAACASR